MTEAQIQKLKQRIHSVLTPLVNNDYVFIDLPYYLNVGDILIWKGTEEFLSTIPYKCLDKASFQTFTFPALDKNTIILMQGGGNFGDLYHWHQDFRISVIKHYPDNPIIILPQTVYYEGTPRALSDAEIMRSHNKLTICVRDRASEAFLHRFHFCSDIRLLPDMAFCISTDHLRAKMPENASGTLLFKRLDSEAKDTPQIQKLIDAGNCDIHDWASVENKDEKCIHLLEILHRTAHPDFVEVNRYMDEELKPHLIQQGIDLIGRYQAIHTTRLHAAILGWLLGKEVHLLDNSYGKLKSFYETWFMSDDWDSTPLRNGYDITLIVPFYNVEPYFEKCLKSIFSQTYTGRVQCLLIDDCGTDNSLQIAEKAIEEYTGDMNVRIIHHTKNRGLSAARNTGLLYAEGEYVFFVDSDDFLSPDALSSFASAANADKDSEMVMGYIQQVGEPQEEYHLAQPGIHTKGFVDMACSFQIYSMAWNKLIRRDFITDNKLFFVEGLVHEDILWNMQVVCFLKRMIVIPDYTYNYVIRPASLKTTDNFQFHIQHLTKVYLLLLDFIFTHGFQHHAALHDFYCRALRNLIKKPISKGCTKLSLEFYRKWRETPVWTKADWEKYGIRPTNRERKMVQSRRLPFYLGWIYSII